MHYHVTLWTTAIEFVTYDVEGAREEEAGTRAADRHLAGRPELGEQDVRVAKIVAIGSYFPHPSGADDRAGVFR